MWRHHATAYAEEHSSEWLKTTFAEWVNNLPCESVIMVGGNHDFALANMYRQPLKISSILSNPTNGKLELLDNEETSVISKDGKIYSIWGTPYCKIFGNWAYMYEPETLIKAYESMPQYCDISRCTQIVWAWCYSPKV